MQQETNTLELAVPSFYYDTCGQLPDQGVDL